MMGAGERVHLLQAYHAAARELVDLFEQGGELIDIDELERLMNRREELIQSWNQLDGGPMNDEERGLAAEIQRMDAISMEAMLIKQQNTREKSSGLQVKRRGHTAYATDYAFDAVFIDKRK